MPEDCKQPSALVVEDNENIAFLLRFMLEREGYRVTVCPDGRQAERAISETPPADIALLDLGLPYKDGFELLQQLRKSDAWATVPVIILTARKLEADVVRGLEHGADDYVSKPYNPRELMARIRRHTRPGHGADPVRQRDRSAQIPVELP